MLKFLPFAFLAVLTVAGCTISPPSTRMPDLTFAQVEPVMLNVGEIEFVHGYQPATGNGHVEHLLKQPLSSATEKLVMQQLQAAAPGNGRVMRVVLEEASVIRSALPVTTGIWDVFRNDPAEIYRSKVSLRFELVEKFAPDIVLGHAQVIGRRNKTLLEGASPADRDRALFEMTEELMTDVGDGLSTVVSNTFRGI